VDKKQIISYLVDWCLSQTNTCDSEHCGQMSVHARKNIIKQTISDPVFNSMWGFLKKALERKLSSLSQNVNRIERV